MATKKAKVVPIKLYRSETDKVLGGVAGGLADYFQVDATLIRIGFVLLSVFGGSGIFVYFVLWLIMPSEQSVEGFTEETVRKNAEDMKTQAEKFSSELGSKSTRQNSRYLVGLGIIALGLMFLFQNFDLFPWFDIGKLWPLILVFIGYMFLTKKR